MIDNDPTLPPHANRRWREDEKFNSYAWAIVLVMVLLVIVGFGLSK